MHQDTNFAIKLETIVKSENFLPVLSPDALKIQLEATKKDPHFSVLASLIRKDPALTGQILKTANSPYYRGLDNAETLKDALTRLGQNEMVNIIMAVVHKQNFRSNNPLIRSFQDRLWNHSVNCAVGSLWTARHLVLSELIPQAFIAGLLHDMGKLHILTGMETILGSIGNDDIPSEIEIEQELNQRHAPLGYNLLTKWHLPKQYGVIARDHHSQQFNLSDRLLAIVRFVNHMCGKIERNESGVAYSEVCRLPEVRMLNLAEVDICELETAIKNDADLR